MLPEKTRSSFASVCMLLTISAHIAFAEQHLLPLKIEAAGYIKGLPYVVFDAHFSQHQTTLLIHQRMNFRLSSPGGFSAAAEFRNRYFWGDEVRTVPGFSSGLRNGNEQVNASVRWMEKNNMVLFSNTERLWLEYKGRKWTLRAGRQRIHWGMANTWNPNDIFNAFNFLDFDYEERPGSDAICLQYRMNDLDHADLALSPSFSNNKTIAAIKYFFNKHGYDWQINAGKYHNEITLGAGWAGNIAKAGFKGEVQYFTSDFSTKAQCNAVMEWDYMFSRGWYVNAGFLWNNRGISSPVNNSYSLNFSLSARNLMPGAYNCIVGVSKEINPLFSAHMTSLFAPGSNIGLLLPSLQYSLSNHWDLSLVWQSFFADINSSFQALTHRGFLRAKLSF